MPLAFYLHSIGTVFGGIAAVAVLISAIALAVFALYVALAACILLCLTNALAAFFIYQLTPDKDLNSILEKLTIKLQELFHLNQNLRKNAEIKIENADFKKSAFDQSKESVKIQESEFKKDTSKETIESKKSTIEIIEEHIEDKMDESEHEMVMLDEIVYANNEMIDEEVNALPEDEAREEVSAAKGRQEEFIKANHELDQSINNLQKLLKKQQKLLTKYRLNLSNYIKNHAVDKKILQQNLDDIIKFFKDKGENTANLDQMKVVLAKIDENEQLDDPESLFESHLQSNRNLYQQFSEVLPIIVKYTEKKDKHISDIEKAKDVIEKQLKEKEEKILNLQNKMQDWDNQLMGSQLQRDSSKESDSAKEN